MSFDKAITLKVGDKFILDSLSTYIVTSNAVVGEDTKKRRTATFDARLFDTKRPTRFLFTEGLDIFGPSIHIKKEYT